MIYFASLLFVIIVVRVLSCFVLRQGVTLFKLALNSQGPTCPCLTRARTKGVCHHTWQEGAMIKI